MSHTFLTFLDLTFLKSNNYRSGIMKIYLSLSCLSLNWYVFNLYAPPSTYQGVLEQKMNVRFFGNVRDLSTPTTSNLNISHMAKCFGLAARLLQRSILQVTFAHPSIAIHSFRKWWCVVKDRGNVQNGLHPFRNKWLLKIQGFYNTDGLPSK